MTSPLSTANRWAVLGVSVFALGCLSLVAENAPALALVNESSSLPRGVYLRRPGAALQRGAIVAVPQPITARPYLDDLGMPAEVLLIKRVGATSGDRVCRFGGHVAAPGRSVAVHLVDRRGRALPQWRECRRLGPHELFLLGDTDDSFDSRYFGPVASGAVTGVFVEAVSW